MYCSIFSKKSGNVSSSLWGYLTEWLRWWTRNPLGNSRVGSNPAVVERMTHLLTNFGQELTDNLNEWMHCIPCVWWGHEHIKHFSLLAVDSSETYDPISYNKNMMAADQNITHALTTSGALVSSTPHSKVNWLVNWSGLLLVRRTCSVCLSV